MWWLGMISGSYKEGEGMCVCVCVVVGDDKWELQGGGVYVGVGVAGCVGVCVCVCVVVGDDKWELQGGGGYVDVWVWWLGMISGSYKEGEGMWVCGCGGWG